ncbi:hypothetical protein WR25_15062 [Diploscapter pachys]|uniref:Uncharacterized protein n=1 Tax=Diploscapter pachys TaxID=2018661 RepID=A0A2A2KM81_9BILA|nr:hypothetical protein WR25_15062 [Diploscapter pachys]
MAYQQGAQALDRAAVALLEAPARPLAHLAHLQVIPGLQARIQLRPVVERAVGMQQADRPARRAFTQTLEMPMDIAHGQVTATAVGGDPPERSHCIIPLLLSGTGVK